MKTALFILHQQTSEAGDIANKLKIRGFNFEISRPSLGDSLPTNLNNYSAIVVFGGPMSANDNNEFMKKEIDWIGQVLQSEVPFLGICVGMQLLADESYENGKHKGLGWIGGSIKKLFGSNLKFPHMGWNNVKIRESFPKMIFSKENKDFYFVHNYYFECLNKKKEDRKKMEQGF